jgi:hypothetical protein
VERVHDEQRGTRDPAAHARPRSKRQPRRCAVDDDPRSSALANGCRERLHIERKDRYNARATPPQAIAFIRDSFANNTDEWIATALNRRNLLTGAGMPWSPEGVYRVRYQYQWFHLPYKLPQRSQLSPSIPSEPPPRQTRDPPLGGPVDAPVLAPARGSPFFKDSRPAPQARGARGDPCRGRDVRRVTDRARVPASAHGPPARCRSLDWRRSPGLTPALATATSGMDAILASIPIGPPRAFDASPVRRPATVSVTRFHQRIVELLVVDLAAVDVADFRERVANRRDLVGPVPSDGWTGGPSRRRSASVRGRFAASAGSSACQNVRLRGRGCPDCQRAMDASGPARQNRMGMGLV